MNVLIVKTSSMGDLIHTLPAITDASRAIPNIQFDWVVEEAFKEIPTWHPAVNQVIPVALRRWRKQPLQAIKNGELKKFYQQLRTKHYDFIIDAQSLRKSAMIAWLARGLRCGMDAYSTRERFAALAYKNSYFIEPQQHAVTRIRQLFAKTLGYTITDTVLDYGIDPRCLAKSQINLPNNYLIFVTNTSWTSKEWPEQYWHELLQKMLNTELPVLLPWGNKMEHARAIRLADKNKNAIVIPKLRLSEIATVLSGAKAVVGLDTGLSHLTAALNVPAVTIYGATSPDLAGALGLSQIHLCVNFPCAPCRRRVCNYTGASEQKPACYTTVNPEKVWSALKTLID